MNILAAIAITIAFCISHAADRKNGYLVKTKKTVTTTQLRLFSDLGIKIVSTIPQIRILRTDKNPLSLKLASADQTALESLIEYVEPNSNAHLLADVIFYDMKLIEAPAAWEITKGSHDVIVGISDSGIWRHGDLIDNLWLNRGETGRDSSGKDKTKNKIDDDANGYVDDWNGWSFATNSNYSSDSMYHGTHVSGTVGAMGGNGGVTGVAWHVQLIAAKFIESDGSGTYEGGINSLIYSADNGARVVNCSWGGSVYSRAMEDAIEYLKTKNVLVVAAAGNDASDSDQLPLYPASNTNENIISVASIGNDRGQLSYFSNWGAKSVDIAAPGENVMSTFNPLYSQLHRQYYYQLSGTSMAAPHVSGAAALLWSINPNLKWNEVKDILLSTGKKKDLLRGKIVSESMLDVSAAVRTVSRLKF